jgi:hypothetical protein
MSLPPPRGCYIQPYNPLLRRYPSTREHNLCLPLHLRHPENHTTPHRSPHPVVPIRPANALYTLQLFLTATPPKRPSRTCALHL